MLNCYVLVSKFGHGHKKDIILSSSKKNLHNDYEKVNSSGMPEPGGWRGGCSPHTFCQYVVLKSYFLIKTYKWLFDLCLLHLGSTGLDLFINF